MIVTVFSTRSYDQKFLTEANTEHSHELRFLEARLDASTALLAQGSKAVCAFVNDQVDRPVLTQLASLGVQLVALRSAGFNHVDLSAAKELGMTVARVPAYSPYAVAEHAVALILTLNRKIHRAYNRVREGNFLLQGLCGFDMRGCTIGVIGTGKIGEVFCQIMNGFGCQLLGYDPYENEACKDLGLRYVTLEELLQKSDIISLHCPLNDHTRHIINAETVAQLKAGAMIVNTGRGALIDTRAAINGLKNGQIGALALDVYEEEEALFFEDRSEDVIQDDVFMRLLTFPNVLVTAHQGFFTRNALTNIAHTTLQNISAFESGEGTLHKVQ